MTGSGLSFVLLLFLLCHTEEHEGVGVLIHVWLLGRGVGREGAAGSAGVGAVRGSRGPLGLFLVGIAE